MVIQEITAKSLLRKHRGIDSWFISRYGMNLYRGCTHNCVYCDGRSEKYYTTGEYGKEVAVKINALELLRGEFRRKIRNHQPWKQGFIMLGGGVGDSYQPAEKEYGLTRKTLEVLKHYKLPVHVLTKSTLVERDIDILKKINEETQVIVSMSFSSVDKHVSSVFEPGVPPPLERLKTLRSLKNQGIACGMFLLPVIPFISDQPDLLSRTIKRAKETELDFIVFGGMTLKQGKQKEYFYQTLKEHYPDLLFNYDLIYKEQDKWGNAIGEYYDSINQTFAVISQEYGIPKRIPPSLFHDIVTDKDLVVIILQHLDYLSKLKGKKSPYGYAAYNISKSRESLSSLRHNLQSIKGVGKVTEKIILEILETGTCSYYEQLLTG